VSKREKLDRSSVFSSLLGNAIELQDAVDQRSIPIGALRFNPRQPRKYIDPEGLKELTESVRRHGVLEPILVRPVGESYELIAGERRTKAASKAGLKSIPAVVLEVDDAQALEIAVVENLQREDINPVEETDAILSLLSSRLERPTSDVIDLLRRLYDEARGRTGNSVISISEREQVNALFSAVGRFSVSSFYTNRIPLLSLPSELLEAVRRGDVHYTKARELARIADAKVRSMLLRRTLEEKLSLQGIRRIIREGQNEGSSDGTLQASLARLKRRLTAKRLGDLSASKRKEATRLMERLEKLLQD
jgi:ParB family transcriptional regulator, chromosome partitioning protein